MYRNVSLYFAGVLSAAMAFSELNMTFLPAAKLVEVSSASNNTAY